MRHRHGQKEGGFTLMEILVSMVILTIGMLGIMALQMTTVKSNRMARELELARVFAAQTMEDLRGRSISLIGTSGTYPSQTVAGTTYTKAYTVTQNTFSTGLVLITATSTFAEDNDSTDTHTATIQMVRTTSELF